jgi:hypothetical protein
MRRRALLPFVLVLLLPSPAPAQVEAARETAREFLSALNALDYQRMADHFQPDAKGKFLIPGAFTEATGGIEVADQFRKWFEGKDAFELVDAKITPLSTKLHLRYGVRFASDGKPSHGEQHVYVALEDGLIASLDLLCSGFFPVQK